MAKPLISLAAAAARWLPTPVKRFLYHLGPASSELRAALNRAAPVGLAEIVVAGGRLAGTRLKLDLQTEKDYWLGTYEMDLQEAIHDIAKPGIIAFDLGANIGYISLLLAKAVNPGGRVYAFEPLPTNQERLRQNMILNSDQPIELVPKAVAERNGKCQFLVHASGGMGKIEGVKGRDTNYQASIEVECVTLDDFVFNQGNPRPDLVKIDIEGGEGLALKGMVNVIHQFKPTFLIELHGEEAAQTCWKILINAGFKILQMRKGYPRITDPNQLDWKNYILARQNEQI